MKTLGYLAFLLAVGFVVSGAQAATYVYEWADVAHAITLDEEDGSDTPLPLDGVRPDPTVIPPYGYSYANGSTALYTLFDLSNIGAGETVVSAEWSFTGYYGSATTVSVSSATSAWEGLTGYSTVINYWNNAYDNELTQEITELITTRLTFDVTSIVQGWLADSSTNYGLRTNGPVNLYTTHESFPIPTLTIETVPEPTTIALLGIGGLTAVLRRRRR